MREWKLIVGLILFILLIAFVVGPMDYEYATKGY